MHIKSVAKGKLQCGHCENCLLKSDCGKCKMYLDKKFGGPGKKKTLYNEKVQKYKIPEISTKR